MKKTLEEIKKRILSGEKKVVIKATKKKTFRIVLPIDGQKHFNLYINDKFFNSYSYDGENWRKG